ncbi:DUF2326 domain-containing protein [Pseudomonas mosselii]|uniref:DUF2326 domain-containing protein n=1 Tax=Pseudomonas mosselii TaxID=78327 RepID=UPI0032E4303B
MMLLEIDIVIDGRVSRVVRFHQGLNLVTNRRGVGRSGNSVGKSTLSRVVDYLFLGSIDPVYIDEEFGRPNQVVENLFQESEVLAKLRFLGVDGIEHEIARNFAVGEVVPSYFFDGEYIDVKRYEELVQEFCFHVFTRRPTVRSVAAKFIRNDTHRMLNTTHFLDVRASGKEYGELYLYLLGFSNTGLLTTKRDMSNLLGRRKRQSQALNAIVIEQKPAAEIKRMSSVALELERDLLKFDYSPEFKDPVGLLQEIQVEEDKFVAALLAVERKISNIHSTMKMLHEQGGSYLVSELREVYSYAQVNVEGALRDFASVLGLHNNLLERKRSYLVSGVSGLSKEAQYYKDNIDELSRKRGRIFSDIRSSDSVSRITEKLKELSQVKLELGKLEGLVVQQAKAKDELSFAEAELQKIVSKISSELAGVNAFVAALDEEFKYITREVHGEEYSVHFELDAKGGGGIVEIFNSVTNPEGGKKKAEVIAFDFAYIRAVAKSNLQRPRFVFHDSIEDVDQKQIEDIFRLATELPGQQIISMLSDKFTTETYVSHEENIVLYLDEDDKFFGV